MRLELRENTRHNPPPARPRAHDGSPPPPRFFPARRDAARARQVEARRDLTNHARSLALGTVDSPARIPRCHRRVLQRRAQSLLVRTDVPRRGTRGPRRRRARRGRRRHHRRHRHRRRRRRHRRRGDASRSPRGVPTRPTHRRSSSAPGKWSHGGSRRGGGGGGGGGGRGSRFGEEQFMRAEWMVDIPADLASAWCVVPRPEGSRARHLAARDDDESREDGPRVASIPIGASRRIVHDATRARRGRLLHPGLRVSSPKPDVLRHGLPGVERDVHVRLFGGDAAELAARQTRDPETAECAAAGPPGPNNKTPSPCPRDAVQRERTAARVRRGGWIRARRVDVLAKDGNTNSARRPWRCCGRIRGAARTSWTKTRG